MKGAQSRSSPFSNQLPLLFLLFLDLAGFTLIFPLIPAMLDHYLEAAAQGPAQGVNIDAWLLSLVDFFDSLLPLEHRSHKNRIILIGGVLAASYSLAQFIAAPYWGRLSDRLGRRPVLLLTSFGFALSYLLWFFSASFTSFCFSRLLGGFMSGNIGVGSAAMADMSPPEKRTNAMGMVGAAFGLGFLLGPVLGGLTSRLDLTSIYWGKHPFGGPALAASLLSLGSAGLNMLWFRETLAPVHRQRLPWITNPLSSSRELMSSQPLYRRVVLINFIYVFIFAAYEFTFSFYYSLEFHLGTTEIGFIFFYLGFWFVLGQGGLVRLLSPRLRPHYLLRMGLAMMPLSLYLFGLCAPFVGLSLLTLIPISLGSALTVASLSGLASLSVGPDKQGYALGLLRSFGALGRTIAPLVAAPFYWLMGPQNTYLLFGALLFLLLLYALYSRLTLKRQQ